MKIPSRFVRFLTLLAVFTAVLNFIPLHPAQAAELTVTNNADAGPGSLRAAILAANPGDTILFDASLSGATIVFSSQIFINKSLTIDGSTLAVPITLSGDTDNNGTGNVSLLLVNPNYTVLLDSLTFTKGWDISGGALYNSSGNLTVANSTFIGNHARDFGGAIENDGGDLTIQNCIFTGNDAGSGGAVDNYNGGSVTITHSAFLQNIATFYGGAIHNEDAFAVSHSTFTGNESGEEGGAIENYVGSFVVAHSTFQLNTSANGGALLNDSGAVEVSNSTFYANTATGWGGGIENNSALTVINSTFSENASAAGQGGGLDNYGSGVLHLTNTILANAPQGGDCRNSATMPTNLNNLVEDGGCGAMLSGDPLLGPLADNGGATHTMSLLPGSPALDAGNDAACTIPPVDNLDQRDEPRPVGAHCDIGAYEYAPSDTTSPTVVSSLRVGPRPTNAASVPFVVTFSEEVIEVDTNDFSLGITGLTGASVSGVIGAGSQYTVTVDTGTGDGTVRLDVPDSATITDLAGNPLSGVPYFDGEDYLIDKTPPTVMVFRNSPNPTNADSVAFQVYFVGSVYGVDLDDLALTTEGLTGASITNLSGAGELYNVTVSTGSGEGTLRLDIAASATIADAAGNPLGNLPFTGGELFDVDRMAPTVLSIVRHDPSPTNAASVAYQVTFSSDVTGVETDDFSLTLDGITGASVDAVLGSGSQYTITVNTGTGDGSLRLDVPDTATITDAVGNLLSDLPFTGGETFDVDRTAPTVLAILRHDPSPTNAASVAYQVTFSSDVTGVETDDFSLTLAGITEASVGAVLGSGSQYTVTVNTGTGDGTLRLDVPDTATITDAVGNPLDGVPYTSGETYTIIKSAPVVLSIVRADPNPTSAESVMFRVTFSGEVQGVDASDFILTSEGVTNANITGVSGSGTVYQVAVATGTGEGTIRLDVVDDDSITTLLGTPLGGSGMGNGDFSDGESYNIVRPIPGYHIFLPLIVRNNG